MSPDLEKKIQKNRNLILGILNCSSIASASLKESQVCNSVLLRLFKVFYTPKKKRHIFKRYVFIYRKDIFGHFLYKLKFDLIMGNEYTRLAERKRTYTRTKKRRQKSENKCNKELQETSRISSSNGTSTYIQSINDDDSFIFDFS